MADRQTGGIEIRRMEPLAAHCRFHVGGEADYFTEVRDATQLAGALGFALGSSNESPLRSVARNAKGPER